MAKGIGREYDVAISAADSDASYTEIGNIKSVDFSDSNEYIDAEDNDSAGYAEGLYGTKKLTVGVTVNYDKSDAGQLAVQQMSEGRLFRYIRVRPNAASGERERRFRCLCVSYDDGGGTNDIKEVSVSFESDGTITYADQ
jgi:hypothetical protein